MELFGSFKAKIKKQPSFSKKNNLILVTAITPGKYGEGKTTTAIGLSQALWKLKKANIVVLREPSLGPCFGIKGGATGGGKATVEPGSDINFHFTGDIHAVTYAHNLLSSLIDNHLFFTNKLNINPKTITWPRVLDLNDRALKEITIKMRKKNNKTITRCTRFDISVSSEIMAILGLCKNFADLKTRLGKIIIGFDKKNNPITAKMLKADNAMAFLLKDALRPNLVQTQENTPAIIHTGPFANIAHGTASLISIKTAQNLAPFTIVEAGFGADLGGEKFVNITSRLGNLKPKAAVLVVTCKAVEENGLENITIHINNLKQFGLNIVVALNRFENDNKKTVSQIKKYLKKKNISFSESFVFQKGGSGGVDLAKNVISACKKNLFPKINYTYQLLDTPRKKISQLCKKIYHAKKVTYTKTAKKQLNFFTPFSKNFFICMAKTQYSISHNPNLKGVPSNYSFEIREIRLASGSRFLIPVSGPIMTMPGLPQKPRAENLVMCQDIVSTPWS